MKLKIGTVISILALTFGSTLVSSSANADSPDVVIGGQQQIFRKATAADFPIIPAVGHTAKVRSGGKDFTVTQLTATCTMSFSASTPYKSQNRVWATVDISRSTGCVGDMWVYGSLFRTNYGGGSVGVDSGGGYLQPGTALYIPLVSPVCKTGWNSTWHSSGNPGLSGGNDSAFVTLPCQM